MVVYAKMSQGKLVYQVQSIDDDVHFLDKNNNVIDCTTVRVTDNGDTIGDDVSLKSKITESEVKLVPYKKERTRLYHISDNVELRNNAGKVMDYKKLEGWSDNNSRYFTLDNEEMFLFYV